MIIIIIIINDIPSSQFSEWPFFVRFVCLNVTKLKDLYNIDDDDDDDADGATRNGKEKNVKQQQQQQQVLITYYG